jgi:hypothetical protein
MFYYYHLFWLHVSDDTVHHQANHKTLKLNTVTIFKYILQFTPLFKSISISVI